MQTRPLGKTGLSISPVFFGGVIVTDESQADADRFVETAVRRGVNYFDVAPSYGNAQARLGPALAPHREQVFLACKTNRRDAKGAKAELLESLELLQTDHFDVYQLHALTTPADLDQAFGAEGAMETVLWAKREGLVHRIGFSTHNEDTALAALDLFPFETVLFPLYWAMGINLGWGDRIAERAARDGFGLLAMKALVHRAWVEGDDRARYPKSWCKPIAGNEALGVAAMRYALGKGAVSLVPPGNFEHFTFMLDHIDACLEHSLTASDLSLLRQEAANAIAHPIFDINPAKGANQ